MASWFSIQVQFFGKKNKQTKITVELTQSFSQLLVNANQAIKLRPFKTAEVKKHFEVFLDEVTKHINEKQQDIWDNSKHIKVPFQTISVPETLADRDLFRSLMDMLSILAFSDCKYEVRDHRLNLKVNGKMHLGAYFREGGHNLKDNYIFLMEDMKKAGATLPPNFICIILDARDSARSLDEEKVQKIVKDIMGASSYIKPLNDEMPKCISLTTDIIAEADSIQHAKELVQQVVNFA